VWAELLSFEEKLLELSEALVETAARALALSVSALSFASKSRGLRLDNSGRKSITPERRYACGGRPLKSAIE